MGSNIKTVQGKTTQIKVMNTKNVQIITIAKTLILFGVICGVTAVTFPVKERERCFQNEISNQWKNKSTQDLLSKLGMWVLPDRRLCFAGRYIKGVILPQDPSAQNRAIKALVVWYLPCLEFQGQKGGSYQINNDCFHRRENELLQVYARLSTLSNHRLQLNTRLYMK